MSTLTLKELQEIQINLKYFCNGSFRFGEAKLEAILSLARRQLEQQEGSPEGPSTTRSACAPPAHSDVPPLGEWRPQDTLMWERVSFEDAFGDSCCLSSKPKGVSLIGANGVEFSKEQIPSLIAHLQSWLLTGSFQLGNQPVQSDSGWLPIDSAPRDGTKIIIGSLAGDGTIEDMDFDAFWTSERESWEIPEVYFYWASAYGRVEEPTHWMTQPPAPSLSADLQTDGTGGAA
jgi:hypothetical protein